MQSQFVAASTNAKRRPTISNIQESCRLLWTRAHPEMDGLKVEKCAVVQSPHFKPVLEVMHIVSCGLKRKRTTQRTIRGFKAHSISNMNICKGTINAVATCAAIQTPHFKQDNAKPRYAGFYEAVTLWLWSQRVQVPELWLESKTWSLDSLRKSHIKQERRRTPSTISVLRSQTPAKLVTIPSTSANTANLNGEYGKYIF